MSDSGTITSEEQARRAVIAEHLPAGYGTGFDANLAGSPEQSRHASHTEVNEMDEPQEESSLLLQGGDIHRSLYKLDARERTPSIRRAQTFSHPHRTLDDDDESVLPADEMLQPQGFRRQFVLQKHGGVAGANLPITRNFVEFLDLYGSFAGEDLADSDDEAIEDDEEEDAEQAGERRPLLPRRKSSRHVRAGDASTMQTFFTLLKAFIGTGIMFLPKAFKNGGILFSSLTMVVVAAISMVAFHLLLQCRARFGGGYGDIGREIAGPRMRTLILGSITLSQLGFVCTGLVFVADNWFSFLKAVTHGANPLSSTALIAIQALIMVPLSFIRNISKLGPAALLADVFIVIGVGYIWYFDISALSAHGIHESVKLFNPEAYTLTIGASIFTFEGIGLILPIQSSMKEPEHFERLLGMVMLLITCVFTSVGAMCYATFGSETKIEVIDNFPQTQICQCSTVMYALAVLVGNADQLFPALRIIEGKIFQHRSGKKDLLTKWKKNVFRTMLVALCIAISIGGSANLDRFVALIGSFACVPLVYIYPPYLHYKGVAGTRKQKLFDIGLMTLGLVGMVYTTAITLATSFL
ncbi:vacuolar amino acid transporter 3 [Verticillium alfalfae VaMs.102]|uniref:Vacuolar amino acid transporter 3 n=1 Tax=Verticillium alfalfae (strain VaMs.102 / ATCC MYA-4576 / FGSC 10136) TaxID=526221 RepID=C9SDC5_VERA1|nr:vacuolar amino acid transporter 3 [Verticillium alfalfae VaMs.102]EEY17077.1 vacuolar amino acid transporter 3 [Verticillium alfalfae VaMs.102]